MDLAFNQRKVPTLRWDVARDSAFLNLRCRLQAEGAGVEGGRAWDRVYPACPQPQAGLASWPRVSGSTAPMGWADVSESAAGASTVPASSPAAVRQPTPVLA